MPDGRPSPRLQRWKSTNTTRYLLSTCVPSCRHKPAADDKAVKGNDRMSRQPWQPILSQRWQTMPPRKLLFIPWHVHGQKSYKMACVYTTGVGPIETPIHGKTELSTKPRKPTKIWYQKRTFRSNGTSRRGCRCRRFLTSDEASFVTGADYKVDGGVARKQQ